MNKSSAQSPNSDLIKEFCQKSAKNGFLFEATFELTNRCNLKCIHCYVDQETKLDYLSLEHWKLISNKLIDIGMASVTLTGGEPLVFPKVKELIAYLFKKNCQVRLFTNGNLIPTKEKLMDLTDAGLCFLETSIYGVDAETHDRITKFPGSWVKTLNVINWAKELGIAVTVKSSWMKENRTQYMKIIKFSDDLGVHFRGSPNIVPNWATDQNLEHRLDFTELTELFKQENKITNVDTKKQSQTKHSFDVSPCGVAKYSLYISAGGDVLPCSHIRKSLGNALSDDMEKIWRENSELILLRKISKKDFKKCENCTYQDYCFICIGDSFIENDDYFTPSAETCNLARARFEAEC